MSRNARNLQPLDATRIEALALAYVARFATTRSRLEAYLRRKVRERGWDNGSDPEADGAGEGGYEPTLAAIVERCVAAGYVDDAAYARAKAASLLGRGYGMRRIGQALAAAGVAPHDSEEERPGSARLRAAALSMARKRRFGPFGAGPPDRALRQKQVAAMLRAGHSLDSARELVDAADVDAAERWAAEAREDDECG